MTPTVAIIILNYNTKDLLLDCLASLEVNPPRLPHTVIVVDNASTDGSVDAVRQRYPRVTVMALDRNAGFAAANNTALGQIDTSLALLLNSDTVVGPQAIDRLVERLTVTGATAAGPRLVDKDGRPEVSFGPMLTPWGEALQRLRVGLAGSSGSVARRYIKHLVGRERNVDWVTGACLLVRRQEAVEAGLFDERYFMYEEDVDFCAALRARGGRVLFTPVAEVVHLRGRSIARAGRSASSHYDRSHLAFYDKHAPAWAPLLRAWLRLRGRAIR